MINGKRILVIGGAGSIGSATVKKLVEFSVGHLTVVDTDENGLADLIRTVRGHLPPGHTLSMQTIPMDFGSALMERYLRDLNEPFDYVFNFAALKHVRSEKDVFSLLRMYETNVIKQRFLVNWLQQYEAGRRYYSVSTDKAANPVSLMGASKRLMEEVLFQSTLDTHVTCARFANVAFSQGSLLNSWYDRISEKKPLPVPENIKRYFISSAEAAEISILTSLFGQDRHVAVPITDGTLKPVLLTDVAMNWVESIGLKPVPVLYDDAEAFARLDADLAEGRYPVLITPSDTDGEKPEEEFIGVGEKVISSSLKNIQILDTVRLPAKALEDLLTWIQDGVNNPTLPVVKNDLVNGLADLLPGFDHVSTGKSLDNRF